VDIGFIGMGNMGFPIARRLAEAGHTVVAFDTRADFELLTPLYEIVGQPFYLGHKPGSGQTMKLVNNLLAATGLIATCEAVAMGVKAGLDATVMIDVLNAGSGGTNASRDKFPLDPFSYLRPRLRHRFDGQGRAALPRRGENAWCVNGSRRCGRTAVGSRDR